MKYVLTGSQNWADECDVYFFEILTEDQYNKYYFLQQTLKEFYGNFCFGTNEGWEDNDFDFLNFEIIEASDEEVATLKKFHVTGEEIFDNLMWSLEDDLSYLGVHVDDLAGMEYSEFCQIIDDNKENL